MDQRNLAPQEEANEDETNTTNGTERRVTRRQGRHQRQPLDHVTYTIGYTIGGRKMVYEERTLIGYTIGYTIRGQGDGIRESRKDWIYKDTHSHFTMYLVLRAYCIYD